MKRDIHALSSKEYDLIVVGGGIFGVCAAWEAVLRGLSVAIVEKADFCHATSANHFKMVHGGIRYLQHGDIYRIRESCRERSALLRIAPHLVKPLPVVIPTYGYGMKSKAVIGAGMFLYDLMTCDRNRKIQKERMIPNGTFISKDQLLRMFPGIRTEGLTGAAVFCDGQMYNAPRLVLSFLRAAVNLGADAANYIEVSGFLRNENCILGVEARDVLDNRSIEIRGRIILNAAGPWAHRLLEDDLGLKFKHRPTFSRDLALVVNRSAPHGHAIAFTTETRDADSLIHVGGRHLFVVGWRDYTLVGVWHKVFEGTPEQITVDRQEINSFVMEVNQAYPGLNLRMEEIMLINTGLTLFGEEGRQSEQDLSFGKRSMLIDHQRTHGLSGLMTMIGVRATTARGMAVKAVDRVMQKLGKLKTKSGSDRTPIYGGRTESVNELINTVLQTHGNYLTEKQARSIVRNYGTEYMSVLQYAEDDSSLIDAIGNSTTLKAELIHAVREEMAQHLTDIVFRRTDLGTGKIPDDTELRICADVMAAEFGWDFNRIENEIHAVGKEVHTVNIND